MELSERQQLHDGFDHAPILDDCHVQELAKRSISKEFALASGVSSRCDNELRKVGFASSIPRDQQKNGLQGLCFSYHDPWTGKTLTWRLKPQTQFNIGGLKRRVRFGRGFEE